MIAPGNTGSARVRVAAGAIARARIILMQAIHLASTYLSQLKLVCLITADMRPTQNHSRASGTDLCETGARTG